MHAQAGDIFYVTKQCMARQQPLALWVGLGFPLSSSESGHLLCHFFLFYVFFEQKLSAICHSFFW
jgi:hypothetical protein